MTAVGASYLLAVNAVTFLFFGMDKKKAQKDQWRVSERTLLLRYSSYCRYSYVNWGRVFENPSPIGIFTYKVVNTFQKERG